MIALSPYHEIFFNEWKLDPLLSDYNVVIDNEIHGDIDPGRMERPIIRLSEDYLLLHSKIEQVDGNYCWVTAITILASEYLNKKPKNFTQIGPLVAKIIGKPV